MTTSSKLTYAPVRINLGQQKEIADMFEVMDDESRNIVRLVLEILGWDVIITPQGYRLERQS